MSRLGALAAAALVLSACLAQCWGVDLPGILVPGHEVNGTLVARVKSLLSLATGQKLSYYALPFCRPEEGIRRFSGGLWSFLEGDETLNSPYKFRMGVPQEAVKVCDSGPLTEDDVSSLAQVIDGGFYVQLLLDGLPGVDVLEEDPEKRTVGFPVGGRVTSAEGYVKPGEYYVLNHLILKVLVQRQLWPVAESTAAAPSAQEVTAAEGLSEHPEARVWDEEEPLRSIGKPWVDPRGLTQPLGSGRYVVVGFEVAAASTARSPEEDVPRYSALKPMLCIGCMRAKEDDILNPKLLSDDGPPAYPVFPRIAAGSRIVFTFDVMWEERPIPWARPLDKYLRVEDEAHWFGILNCLVLISLLAALALAILLRCVHRDFAKMEPHADKEAAGEAAEGGSGWKLVAGDAFRPPPVPGLLCTLVADGVQLLGMAAAAILFAPLGLMFPASRGALLVAMALVYLLLGTVAGYVGGRLWVMITGTLRGAAPLALKVACSLPFYWALCLGSSIAQLWGYALPDDWSLGQLLWLYVLWLLTSVPLTGAGASLGMRSTHIRPPVPTNKTPRPIPSKPFPAWVLLLGGGVLPFGALYAGLFFILSSVWMQRVYYCFSFLFLGLLLLIAVSAEVAAVLTYLLLTREDYRWWWHSFFASGSPALVYFGLSCIYFILNWERVIGSVLEPPSPFVAAFHFLVMALSLLVAIGAVGFLGSACFVYYLFSAVKTS